MQRNSMKTKCLLLGCCVVLLMGVGCASKGDLRTTGFLQDYSGLEPGPKGGAALRYVKEGVDWKQYDKVMLDEVALFLSQDADFRGIYLDEMEALEDIFHKSIVQALGDKYPLTSEPGPGVLRLRPAITGLVPSRPVLNTVSTIVPVGLAISHVKKAATGVHANVGLASMEAELLDSQTNEQLAAVVDKRSGAKYQVIKGMSKWGHVKDIFDTWAKRLRMFLDEARGETSS